MSDLLVIAFPDDAAAFRARAELVRLQKDVGVEMEDVAVVTRSDAGQVQLHQAVNVTAAGVMGGTLWGSLVGLLFLNPLLGAAGARSGVLSGAMADLGIDDAFLREVGGTLDGGGAALALLLRKLPTDRAADRLGSLAAGGRLVQTPLPLDIEERLRRRLEGGPDMTPATTSLPHVPTEDTAAAPPPGLGNAPGAAPGAASAIPGASHSAATEP